MELDSGQTSAAGSLTRAECLELLATADFGRVAVVADGQPLIFPVNFVLDGERVVFRTDPGTKLEHASIGRVAFEVDNVDHERHEGWSVVVLGTALELTDALDDASVREQALPLRPWAGGAKDHWIRIAEPRFSGRRVTQREESPGPSTR
jgi:nitroimidazol reductase NimA-like FMN-containing flavoprotein (pyridoxamine 5'-phosphate oxidase superfamily)